MFFFCSQNSKFSQFQIFPKLDPRGGALNFKFFPNSKKSKTSWERGGSRKLWTFSTFCDIFNSEASLIYYPWVLTFFKCLVQPSSLIKVDVIWTTEILFLRNFASVIAITTIKPQVYHIEHQHHTTKVIHRTMRRSIPKAQKKKNQV